MVHALKPGVTLLDLLEEEDGLAAAGERALRAPSNVVTLDDVHLRAPVQPRSIRDCTGFLQHLRNCASSGEFEVKERFARVPAFYFSNPAAVIGPCDDVAIFPGSRQFDYELEHLGVLTRIHCLPLPVTASARRRMEARKRARVLIIHHRGAFDQPRLWASSDSRPSSLGAKSTGK